MTAAAISGDYTDLKFIRTRKVCQIVVEIPIEQAGAFVEAFGTPRPDGNVPVALAKLDLKATQSPADNQPKEKKRSRAQEAGILCNDARFGAFLCAKWPSTWSASNADAAEAVRLICEVGSRSNLDHSERAGRQWDELRGQYLAWLQVAA